MILIADLDGTLVDTSTLDRLREKKRWRDCVSRLEETLMYPDWEHVLQQCEKIAIVTAAVSYYAERLLAHHGIPYDCLIAWHDTKLHKPHPDPVVRALEQLGVSPSEAIGIGDLAIDATSYKRAGVLPAQAAWNPRAEDSEAWARVLASPTELLN